MKKSDGQKINSFDTSTTSRLVIKIALLFTVLIFIATIGSGFFHYNKNVSLILKNLQNQLTLAANTIAVTIDGDAYQKLEGKASVGTPEYRKIRLVLEQFIQFNKDLGFEEDCVYTFRQISEDSLEFTVMLHDRYVGNRYAIRPEMRPTLAEGKPGRTDMYHDENGTWVSAYAPILNREFEIVGIVEVDFKDNVYLMALTDEKYTIILFSLVSALAAMLAAVLLSRLISRPINKISNAVIQFSAGDLNTQVEVKGRDEIGMLARAFNYMVQEIKEKEFIRSQNQELREAYRKLDTLNKTLQEANTLKTEFLNIAAHDLKNPLQAILGFAEMIMNKEDQHPHVHRNAEKIHRATQRMFGIISHLLDKTALEQGAIMLNKELADVGNIARQVINQNQSIAAQKNQRIELTCEKGCEAMVDVIRIHEVLDNLLSNAIKYSEPGKAVRVRVRCTAPGGVKNGVRFSVQDRGSGLSKSDMLQLFQKYSKLSSKPTAGESSTGIGLSVVKQLVELHGGKVWAESDGKGKGTTFFVELP